MKKYITYIAIAVIGMLLCSSCNNDEGFFGEEIFNEETKYPYVSIQDRNEILDSLSGNNFWGFALISENGGNQVRIAFDSQDTNIESHDIIVGFDDSISPPEDGVLLRTLVNFPDEIVITKQDLAAALDVSLESLESGSVFFGGRSNDTDGNVVDDPSVFELFLGFERHAYFYEWDLGQ